MKAIVYHKYGSVKELQLKEVEKPTPKSDQVLIKVHATSVNASDWEILRGKPIFSRMSGLFKPGKKILGSDVAGQVEAVGEHVTEFQSGDQVYGDLLYFMGGFAEYVCAPVDRIARLPAHLSYAEAACLPQSGAIALKGICDAGQVQAGQKVLINGAGGGTGTLAIQLAKLQGAEVTGVDNASKLDTMRALGADHVLDYQKQNFTKNGEQYDLILDLVAHQSVAAYRRALKPGGKYFMVGGPSLVTLAQILLSGPRIKEREDKTIELLSVPPNRGDFSKVAEMVGAGEIEVIIDKQFSLNQVPDALAYLGGGQAIGKLVIVIN